MVDWEHYRHDWPHIDSGLVWLQHAGITPLCRRVMQVGVDAMHAFANHPALNYRRLWAEAHEGTRARIGAFLGCPADNLALVKNTSQGIIFVAESLPYAPGDNLVILAGEYPANRLPWRTAARHGAKVRVVEPDDRGRFTLDLLDAAIDHDTRAVAVSWVQYLNGFRIDLPGLAELCRRYAAFLVVDAVQGVGALPLDLTGIDAAAVGGHKWLCGTEGAGFLYVSDRLLPVLQPFNVSWHSVADDLSIPGAEIDTEPGVPALKAAAERFEEGTPNLFGNLMLGEAVTMLQEIGVDAIAGRHRELQDYLIDLLVPRRYRITSSLEPDQRSGILCLDHPEHDPDDLVARLKAEGIICLRRGGSVRLSPHFYNNLHDMDRVAAVLP